MSTPLKKNQSKRLGKAQRSQPQHDSSYGTITQGATASSAKPASEHQEKSARTKPAVVAAQAEFLEDIRVSLQEMKEGKVLPAEEALKLIEQGLDDDELESYLPQ